MNFSRPLLWLCVLMSETRLTLSHLPCDIFQLEPVVEHLSDLLEGDNYISVAHYDSWASESNALIKACAGAPDSENNWVQNKYDETTQLLTGIQNDKPLFGSLTGEQQFYVLYSKILSTLGRSSLHLSSSGTAIDFSDYSSLVSLAYSLGQFFEHPLGRRSIMADITKAVPSMQHIDPQYTQRRDRPYILCLEAPGCFSAVSNYLMAKLTLDYLHRPIECIHFLHLSIDSLATSMLVWDQEELSQYAESVHLLHVYLLAYLKAVVGEVLNDKDLAVELYEIYLGHYTLSSSSLDDSRRYEKELIKNLNIMSVEIDRVLGAKGIGRIPGDIREYDKRMSTLMYNNDPVLLGVNDLNEVEEGTSTMEYPTTSTLFVNPGDNFYNNDTQPNLTFAF